MYTLTDIYKAAPEGFAFQDTCTLGHAYRYFVCGKGCTLGVLFEDSVNVYFEWLMEGERLVPYGPEIRYRAWPKREFARLMAAGVWEATCAV